MGTKSFIRVLWGQHPQDVTKEFEDELKRSINSYYITFADPSDLGSPERAAIDDLKWISTKDRLGKVKGNIEKALREPIKIPYICYTFGEENHKWLLSKGVESVLINKFSNPFYMYRHKMEAWVRGMQDFDEIVFLDWDTRPIKPIDDEFWSILRSKDVIQASLGKYMSARLTHRAGRDNKWNPSGSFVYMRDKSLPTRAIELWKKQHHKWTEEVGLAMLTDELMGTFDFNTYEKRFDPDVYQVKRNPFIKEQSKSYFYNLCHPWKY